MLICFSHQMFIDLFYYKTQEKKTKQNKTAFNHQTFKMLPYMRKTKIYFHLHTHTQAHRDQSNERECRTVK